jgi:hypothetical protein
MKLWIARDENGQLWLFDKPPVLRDKKVEDTNHSWFDMAEDGIYNYCLSCDMFPEVTFANSPQEVELKLINNVS